ncbi:hypothetical protein R1sor_008350 [Riccia sorocarpa]|uniref:Uncharacterized protein n=1 Tax=Riccia sorocarpa TaxID=122646 RepID=A0ABD3HZD6_9MARC
MRNAPVDGKLPVGSTESTENIVYYDDIADHDFPDDSEMSLDDSAVLPGMEVRDKDTLDAYFDVTSEVLPIEAIRNYTIVDDIDKTKARTLGVGEERLKQLNSHFGVAHNGVGPSQRKEPYSHTGRLIRQLPTVDYRSQLNPANVSRPPREDIADSTIPVEDNGAGPSQREESSSPRDRSLRQQASVDYKSQLNPPK